MNLIEFIAFIITMLLFLLLSARQAREERYRRDNPEEFEDQDTEQEVAIREMLEGMGIKVEKDIADTPTPTAPPQPPIKSSPPPEVENSVPSSTTSKPKTVHTVPTLDPYKQNKSDTKEEAYLKKYDVQSRGRRVVKGATSLRDAMILKEVLGPPKGLE